MTEHGPPWYPSNATDADYVFGAICAACLRKPRCRIPVRCAMHGHDEPGYPRELYRDENDNPQCARRYTGAHTPEELEEERRERRQYRPPPRNGLFGQ